MKSKAESAVGKKAFILKGRNACMVTKSKIK
jgi:hypothetical protein